MSFGINGPDSNMPSIQKSHHTNDGGAGNLGYFQRRQKKEEKEDENDVFEFSSEENKEEHEDPLMENLNSIGNKIKGWLGIKNKEEKNPEET